MNTSFSRRYGPWAVVTGASSGIGEALARGLAARGLSVVLAARRKEKLAALADELSRQGVEARVAAVDLEEPGSIDALEGQTRGLDLGLVVANAGFGDKGAFVDADRGLLSRMVDLNCRGTMLVCHAFAARLVARGRGGLVVTSSTAAFQGIPYSAVYAATKAFDLLLAEALHHELRPLGVDVVALCPGATATEGPRRTGVNLEKIPLGMMEPGPVAEEALNALGRRPVVVPGAHNKAAAVLVKVLPREVASAAAGRVIRRGTKK